MGTIVHLGQTYQFSEVSFGGKTRGICVALQGAANSSYSFKLLPNPHDNPKYNKNPGKFYQAVATGMVNAWPPQAGQQVDGLGETYTLTAR